MCKLRFEIWCILFLLFYNDSKAQNYEHLFDQVLEHKTLTFGVNLHQELASNGITHDFFMEYISGGFIDDTKKNNAIERLKPLNRAVIKYGGNAFVKFGLKSSSLRLTVGLDYLSFNEVLFNKDIFILYFEGNKNFEGKNAALTPFAIERSDFSTFKIGVEKDFNSFKFAFNVGLSSGLDHLDLKAEEGYLFTALDGRYVDLQMKLKSFDWTGRSSSVLNTKALGVVFDGGFTFLFNKNFDLNFGIRNLGFLDWTSSITERTVDTLYRYTGLEIDNLLDSFSIKVKDVEEIESDFVSTRDGLSRRSYLPSEWTVSVGMFLFNRNLYLNAGMGGIRSDFAEHVYFLNSQYRFSPNFAGGVLLKRNPYAEWDLGVHANLTIAETFGLQLYWESLSFIGDSDKVLQLTGGISARMRL